MWRVVLSRSYYTPLSGFAAFEKDWKLSSKFYRLASAMIGDPDVVGNSRLVCSVCHEERSHCGDCAEKLAKSRALPISQLLRTSQVDFVTRSKLLVVEGNIGVGKTTLAKKLGNALGYKLCLEPTTENPYLGE